MVGDGELLPRREPVPPSDEAYTSPPLTGPQHDILKGLHAQLQGYDTDAQITDEATATDAPEDGLRLPKKDPRPMFPDRDADFRRLNGSSGMF